MKDVKAIFIFVISILLLYILLYPAMNAGAEVDVQESIWTNPGTGEAFYADCGGDECIIHELSGSDYFITEEV